MTTGRMRLFIEAITGQNNLIHNYSKQTDQDDLCRLCQEHQEDFVHLINDCPALWQKRWEIPLIGMIESTHEWTLHEIETFINIPVVHNLLSDYHNNDDWFEEV